MNKINKFITFSWANILNIDLNPINVTGIFRKVNGILKAPSLQKNRTEVQENGIFLLVCI